jgi:hypothetical protein
MLDLFEIINILIYNKYVLLNMYLHLFHYCCAVICHYHIAIWTIHSVIKEILVPNQHLVHTLRT